MKFVTFVSVILFAASTLAQDDCDAVCASRHDALVAAKDQVQEQLSVAVRERDELVQQRNELERTLGAVRDEVQTVVRTRDELQASMDTSRDEKSALLKEVEEARKALDKNREDMAHYQKVAQDNQKYMQEYKNQLHTQRDKANKLDVALQEANAKIEELESTTLIKILQKELASAWKAITEYWDNLRKGKEGGNSEF